MNSNGTIILPDWLITTPHEAPKALWGIRMLAGKVDDVAPNAELRKRYPGDDVWEAKGQVLAPGFVDAHTHLYGVLAHGIPLSKAPSGFWPFLADFWWPMVENALDSGMIDAATDLNCARMIQSGITSFYDCTEAPYALPGCLSSQAQVVRGRGLRGILSFESTQRVSKENGQLGLQENAGFIDECRQSGGLVSGLMCFHTTFSCSADFIKQAFAMAADKGVLTHLHCSEGLFEPENALKNFGVRPIIYYDRLGVAGPGMLASQCVQISAEEIDVMAKRSVRMTHMPLSNCEVGAGFAPVPELVDAGVTVGLGSDGYVTDFYEVMRGAFLMHKSTHCNPQVMPAHLVWYLATEGGARAVGFEKVGRLEKGWSADWQLVEPHLPTRITDFNLYDQLLLYCDMRDVRATCAAGNVLMKDGVVQGVDFDSLMEKTRVEADRLWAKASS
jgi:5-methylthioadenosine/S-adenosylhomocysteine deaminase